MPTKDSYDGVTNPMRQKYTPPPMVETDAPAIWMNKPAKGMGIPGKYSYPKGMGPMGTAPMIKT